MKNILIFLLAAALCSAASAPSVTEGPIVPWRIQVDLAFDGDGVITSAAPKVYYRQTIMVDATAVVIDRGSILWDSVAKANEEVTISLANGGTATTTRGKILAAVIAIAAEERANPPVVEEP
jgi:hypothetical protein